MYVFPSKLPEACRGCGATEDLVLHTYRLCYTCTRHAQHQMGVRTLTEERVLTWLARKLARTAQQVAAGQIVGRCEARSKGSDDLRQCASHAQTMREGRKVCTTHANAKTVVFVGEERISSEYDWMASTIRDLAAHDKHFRKVLRRSCGWVFAH